MHYLCSKCLQRYSECKCPNYIKTDMSLLGLDKVCTDTDESVRDASGPDEEARYLETCAAWEKKSLDVSRASKALELLKKELHALGEVKENMRRRLVGDSSQQGGAKR